MKIITLDLGSVVAPENHPDAGNHIAIQAFAIQTSQGLVLVDTGLGAADPEIDAFYHPSKTSLRVALHKNRLSRDRVVAVVASHLHFDHAGALPDFPGIPVHVQRRELLAAQQPDYTLLSRIRASGLAYVEHDGTEEIFPGITLVATPGHTPGHQSVAVHGEKGVVVLACQAAYTLEEWAEPSFQHPAGELGAWDGRAYRQSLENLRAMEPVEARFSHDRRVWRGA